MLPENSKNSLAELEAEMETLKASMSRLQQRMTALHGPGEPAKAAQPTTIGATRRKTLKRLGLALLGGATAAIALDGVTAQARFIANPQTNGLSGRAGAVILQPGAQPPIGIAPTYQYGLIASSNVYPFDMHSLPSFGTGVYGSGDGCGVWGNGAYYGVNGIGGTYGVSGYGTDTGVSGYGTDTGVHGSGDISGGLFYSGTAVTGNLPTSTRTGVLGMAGGSSNLSAFTPNYYIGVYGYAPATGAPAGITSLAAYFEGNVKVNGNLAKNGSTFKIDHPLDPANKYLSHSVVESPDMMNIYNGNVTLDEQGEAGVEMPDWFETLNRDFRYQLTALGQAAPELHVCQEINRGKFNIGGGLPGQKVSWQVTGIRQDAWANAHRVQVEEDKAPEERGKYFKAEDAGK